MLINGSAPLGSTSKHFFQRLFISITLEESYNSVLRVQKSASTHTSLAINQVCIASLVSNVVRQRISIAHRGPTYLPLLCYYPEHRSRFHTHQNWATTLQVYETADDSSKPPLRDDILTMSSVGPRLHSNSTPELDASKTTPPQYQCLVIKLHQP